MKSRLSKTSLKKTAEPIRAFCVDLNWDTLGRSAAPGLYAQADPEDAVRWCHDLGANTIQTFCVSFNGFAWYPSDVAPMTPGLKENFLQKQVAIAKKLKMRTMGYFCLGSNTYWEQWLAPKDWHRNTLAWSVSLTQKYIDYFCASVKDSLQKTDIDGFMIDWVNRTCHREWLDCEKIMWKELMGERFPQKSIPNEAATLEFDRRAIDRAWGRIKATVDSTRKALIWTNHPFTMANDPLWNNTRIMKEVDWVLNESPSIKFLKWLEGEVGAETKIIQNCCGWHGHSAETFVNKLDLNRYGVYGFAAANPTTALPWTYKEAQIFERSLKNQGRLGLSVNAKNIDVIKKFYHRLKKQNQAT